MPRAASRRLRPDQLRDHLALVESAALRRTVAALRGMILEAAPQAVESLKFHCLCYHDSRAEFGAVGGNICMIEMRRGRAVLSFIHGHRLEDPQGLLEGRAKAKRFVVIADAAAARDSGVVELVRAAARQVQALAPAEAENREGRGSGRGQRR